MKTNKAKLLAVAGLGATFAVATSCLFITACSNKTDNCKIEWKVDANATVAVADHDTLPTEWEKDTELSFTATAKTGYDLSVKAYSMLSANNGKYSFKVTKDATVTVSTSKIIESIEIKTPPTQLDEYYTDDSLNTDGMVITVKYAIGETEDITEGFTVVHGKVDAENKFTKGEDTTKFAKDDNAFVVTYKGLETEAVKLAKAVEDKFGFTSVKLEIGEDGKPYYVLKGVYGENLLEEFKHVGFDFQEQGFYSEAQGGSAGWAYTKYTINMPDENLVNGVYTLRVDMSDLAVKLADKGIGSMMFNPHMGFKEPGDNNNPNVSLTEGFEEGQSITVDGIKYTIHRQLEEDDQPNTTWGMVAVIVSDANFKPVTTNYYAKDDVTLTSFGLEERDGKPAIVIKGSVANYVASVYGDEEDVLQLVYFNTVQTSDPWGNIAKKDKVTQTFSNVNDTAKTADFEIVWDISEIEVGCWFHLGEANNDIAGGKMAADKATLTIGGKTYTLTPQASEDASPALSIEDAAAAE